MSKGFRKVGTGRLSGPLFLQLLTLDASEEEIVAREQIITPTSEDLTRRRLRFAFADLVPGRYALKAFQDTNGNGRIDISLFGPKEPWATHRPARPKLRPPRFEEMAFEATASVTDIELVLR